MITEVTQVEQTIRNLMVVAEHSSEAIALADYNGNLRFLNMAWARIHGYEDRMILVGKPISMFHTEEQFRKDVSGFIEEAKHRGHLEGPIWHRRKDGTTFPTQTKMIALMDMQGNVAGLTIFVTDMSKISQAEELLRQRTAELKKANEQIHNNIAVCRRLESELHQHHSQLEQNRAELNAVQQELHEQISERERVEDEAQQYCNGVEWQMNELAAAINKVVRFAESGTDLVCHKA